VLGVLQSICVKGYAAWPEYNSGSDGAANNCHQGVVQRSSHSWQDHSGGVLGGVRAQLESASKLVGTNKQRLMLCIVNHMAYCVEMCTFGGSLESVRM